MTVVNIAGTFKKDDRDLNGLEAIAGDLANKPLERRVVAAIVETKRVITDFADGGSERVVVRVVHVEPLTGDHADDAKKYLDEAWRARTGRDEPAVDDTLPFGDSKA